MIAVITGDIINSQISDVERWIIPLKKTLQRYGSETKHWDIFRGDSFQLALAPEQALLAALHIKSTLKQDKLHDVRMAIGLGAETYSTSKITEANGSAYVNSGACFEQLKKQNLAIKSDHEQFDETLNIMFSLSLLTTNTWSSTVSEVIKTVIEHPDEHQKQLAKRLNKSQSTISEALKRGGFEEIMMMNTFYKHNISQL
ncbi:MAG: SatD family protein [Psychroserpens sp.]|uniref:SatD family protein n=1 Tax=Psychroserpens sp. TaxID=2020870 RepID=UPI003C96D1A3